MAKFAKTLLVDTGFWFALYKETDGYHLRAQENEELLESTNLVIPWPSLYETVNSQFVKRDRNLRRFESLLRQPHVTLLTDEPYKEAALKATFETALKHSRYISLVDMVIRLIIEDDNVRKQGLLTFNPRDFHDVCQRHGVEMIP